MWNFPTGLKSEVLSHLSITKNAYLSGEGLDKIRSKDWAEPLGVGLQVTGEIFQMAGEAGVPVIGLIGNYSYNLVNRQCRVLV